MESFYWTFKSADYNQYFPNNSPGDFFAKLPRHKELHGKWQVALAAFYFPMSFPVRSFSIEEDGASFLHRDDFPRYLNIFCDVAELSDVGKMHGPYLGVYRVPNFSNEATAGNEKFKFHYYNVVKQNIDKVRVYLLDENGREVSFTEGEVYVTLHFRKLH